MSNVIYGRFIQHRLSGKCKWLSPYDRLLAGYVERPPNWFEDDPIVGKMIPKDEYRMNENAKSK